MTSWIDTAFWVRLMDVVSAPLPMLFIVASLAFAAAVVVAETGVKNRSRLLRDLVHEHLGKSREKGAWTSKEPLHAFARALDDRRFDHLATQVREFAESTHVSQPEGVLFNAFQAADFFRVDRCREELSRTGNRTPLLPPSVQDVAPGLLTSIGILGTFVGIVVGLIGAQTNDPNMPLDIEALMGGLGISFVSSLFGLFLSIVVTVVGRQVDAIADDALTDLILDLDRAVERRTPQQLLERLVAQQEQATGALQTLKTDLSEALERALNQAVATHLAPTFQMLERHTSEMKDATIKLAEGSAERQVEGVSVLVERFKAQMNDALGEPMIQAGQALTGFAATQANVTELWSDSAEQLVETTLRLEASTRSQHELVERVNQVLASAKGVSERIEATGARLSATSQALAAQLDATRHVTATQQEASANTLSAVQQMHQAMAARLQAWETITAEFDRLNHELVDGMTHFAAQFPEQIRGNLELFDAELARAVDHLGKAYSGLRDQVIEFNDSFAEAVDRLPRAHG
ncbi:MAG: hypothetical protein H6732_17055 [Alphaproteobacteria bacterium]|nr:hypothetical protein [Alphaproteobacteria bacterium]